MTACFYSFTSVPRPPLSLLDSRMCKRLSDAQQSITMGFDIAFPVITLTVTNSALRVNKEYHKDFVAWA